MNHGPLQVPKELTPLTNEELTSLLTVMLRARRYNFPQLRGRGVSRLPVDQDALTKRFAAELVKLLRGANLTCSMPIVRLSPDERSPLG